MKIIATVSDGYNKTYLAEVTLDEIATITRGVQYSEARDRVDVGTVVNVGDHWAELEKSQQDLHDTVQSAVKVIALVAEVLGVSVTEALDLNAPAATGASANGAPAAAGQAGAGSKTNRRKKTRHRPIQRVKSGKSRPDLGSPSPAPSG